MSAWRLASAGACVLAGLALPGPAPAAPADNVGRSIYLRGVLGSGAPLEGTREAGVVTTAADAACVNCHQRSGLGSVEGSLSIPPVTGEYLFHSRAHDASGFEATGAYAVVREDRRGRAKPQRRRGARRACVGPRTK